MRGLLATVLLVSLLSGCTAIGGGDGPALATAQQAQGPADRAAKSWDAGAILMGISAFEIDDASREEFKDDMADSQEELKEARDDGDIDEEEYRDFSRLLSVFERITDTPDAHPGDGKAAVWFFAYARTSDGAGLGVAVSRGAVLYTDESDNAADEFDLEGIEEPLGEWRVDSDEAATAAALGSADYAALRQARNVVTYTSLVQGEDGPVWFVGAERQDGFGEGPDDAFLAVDANTGSLIVDQVITPVEELLVQESGRELASFTAAVQATYRLEFEVEDVRHLQLAVDMTINPAPLQPIGVKVTDPLGTATTFSVQAGQAPFFAEGSALMAAPAGTYLVEITSQLSVRDSFNFSWCTDGEPTSQGDFQPRACTLLPDQSGNGGEMLSRLDRSVRPW